MYVLIEPLCFHLVLDPPIREDFNFRLGARCSGFVLHPFLTSSVKRIKYAIKAAKMGRTNIPKDFLQLGADSERVIRAKNSRQRKCSIIWLEDPIPQSLHNSLLQGIFGFRSGMHGLHEELGRHRGREGRKE